MFERPSDANVYGKTWGVGFNALNAVALPTGPNPNADHKSGANYLFADGHIEYMDFMDAPVSGGVKEKSAWYGSEYFKVK